MTDAQRQLISEHVKIIFKMVHKKYKGEPKHIRDDLCSVAFEMICDRIDDFDPNRGEFYNFAYNVIKDRLNNVYFREILPYRKNVEINLNMLNEIVESGLTGIERFSEDEKTEFVNYRDKYLYNCIDELEESEKYIINNVFFNDRFINDVAKDLNLNGVVYYRYKKALGFLKGKMNYFFKLYKCINKLPDHERVFIKKIYLENRDFSDIKVEMGADFDRIKTNALTLLKKELGDYNTEDKNNVGF